MRLSLSEKKERSFSSPSHPLSLYPSIYLSMANAKETHLPLIQRLFFRDPLLPRSKDQNTLAVFCEFEDPPARNATRAVSSTASFDSPTLSETNPILYSHVFHLFPLTFSTVILLLLRVHIDASFRICLYLCVYSLSLSLSLSLFNVLSSVGHHVLVPPSSSSSSCCCSAAAAAAAG